MAGNGATTPQAVSVGIGLRGARETAGWTLRGLAEDLGLHAGTLSRWETGQRLPRPEDVALILGRLGVADEQRDELIDLARTGDQKQWLSLGSPHQMQRQLATLLEFEATAARITCVAPLLIPGLMQTSGYARAIIQPGGFTAEEVELRVAVRMGRRDVLTRPDSPRLLALIGEHALRTNIGGPDVMRTQLARLLEMAAWDSVDLQVIPLASGWQPALMGMFVVVERGDGAPIVHMETLDSGLFLHETKDTAGYRRAVDMVSRSAMEPTQSAQFIADVLSEMDQ